MSEESIKNPPGSGNTFAPSLIHSYPVPDVKFGLNCLINSNTSSFRNVINLNISCSLDAQSPDFILDNCLFGAVKLTINADPDKYRYNGYGIGLGSCSQSLLSDGNCSKNVITFGIDNTSCVHFDNDKKDILVLVEDHT